MNPSHLVSTLAVVALSATLTAQSNLLTNGDFEGASLSPWKETGYRLSSAVSSADTTGVGASNCFNCLHGGMSGQTRKPNGYWPGNAIEQPVLQVQTVTYLFTADVMVTNVQSPNTGNADAGQVELFIDGNLIGNYDFGRYVGNTTHRARMCIKYTAAATNPTANCSIAFSRKYYSSSRTPTVFIDNAQLVQGPRSPIICPIGERKINTTANIAITGTANARFGLFVGFSKLASPVTIPGFSGQWVLGNPMENLFIVSFDSKGEFAFKPAVPAIAKGIPIWWQGIEAPTATSVVIGEPAMFGFY